MAKRIIKKENIIKFDLDRYVLLYLLVNLFYVFFNRNGIVAGIYGARVTIFPVFMYFFARDYFIDKNRLQGFITIILICSLADITYGLYQQYIGFPYFDLTPIFALVLTVISI